MRPNYYSYLRNRIDQMFSESVQNDYENRKDWNYSSIRFEIDRIMDAHTKSDITISNLEKLKKSVGKQLLTEKNKYSIQSVRNGYTDIINCISAIELHKERKALESIYNSRHCR